MNTLLILSALLVHFFASTTVQLIVFNVRYTEFQIKLNALWCWLMHFN